MSEYFQYFNHLIKIYIQCTIQNSQTSKRFCCLLYMKLLAFSLLTLYWSPLWAGLSIQLHQCGLQNPSPEYSDLKNPFHTNPKYSVRSVPPYSVGVTLSFGGVIHSTYPWLQDCSLGHVIWATGCRNMINLEQQYHDKGICILSVQGAYMPIIRSIQIFSNFILILWTYASTLLQHL